MKKIVAILMIVVSIFSLVACGGSGSSEKTEENTEGKVTIKVPDYISNNVEGVEKWKLQRQEQFAKDYPDIIVQHVSNLSGDSKKNVQTMINNLSNDQEMYTVLIANNNTYARTVYQTGLSANWFDYLPEGVAADFLPEVVEGLTSNGALTGYPTSLTFPTIGFSRKHLRSDYVKEQLGVDPGAADANDQVEAIIDSIETWDDYLEVTKKLSGTYSVAGVQRTVSGYGGWLTDFYIGEGFWAVSNGYTALVNNSDRTMTFNLDTTEFYETIDFLRSLVSEGALTHNVYLEYTDFFAKIFRDEVASFIYYPDWQSWFQSNGYYMSDIKVINFPIGPSMEANLEKAANDSSIEVQNSNPAAVLNYVLNAKASDEEKKAAALYINYMYGKEAYLELMEYVIENSIENLSLPVFKLDEEILEKTTYQIMPDDWKEVLKKSRASFYLVDVDSDAFINYVNAAIPGVIAGSDTNGTYDTADAVHKRLQGLTDLVYREWLTAYNDKMRINTNGY